ncbi:MAG TPA: UvrB/UvrC motif-containing protein [candidate division Zixibacteria bacterium]|nr:UvrB/UvrC motif-containing protein [candidate division Zixibacteria bacterium]
MQKFECNNCGRETDGSVKITQIRGGQKTVVTLCRECASEMGFHNPLDQMPFPLAKILGSFVEHSMSQFTEEVSGAACPNCGMTFAQFSQQGRFGCGACYETFRPQLETILRKIHGHSIHRGKMPTQDGSTQISIREQERLESEYKLAIEREEFERAAELRDRLKDIRAQLKNALEESRHPAD